MFESFRQTLKIVIRALRGNKTRSFLTMLGIIIGVGAVVLIMSLGAGAQSLILSQLEGFGSDLIGVLPGQSEEKGPPAAAYGIKITSLKEGDALAFGDRDKVPHAIATAAYYETSVTASWRGETYDASLLGIAGDYLEIDGGEVAQGRFLSEEEMSSGLSLAVLGSQAATELFGGNSPLGQNIKVKGRPATVIGVMKERGQVAFQNYDNIILMPLKFVQKDIAGIDYLSYARVKADSVDNIDETMENVRQTLRERHDIDNPDDDDFSVRSFRDALDMITSITNAIRYFLAAMAALSLLVGGIGIMNIMLVSVTERTREIGLRKSIGATNRQVLGQFLLEAVILTLLGGFIGLLAGAFLAYLVSLVVGYLGYRWDFALSPFSIAAALGLSLAIGAIFGYYPARRASRLSPVDALRYE